MSIRFEIDASKLENNPAVIAWYQEFAQECLREAQKLAAERISGGTGVYERSFTFELIPGSPPKLRFGNTAKHAVYIEEGTDPHVIVPNQKKALRWFEGAASGSGPSNQIFATKVNHPGTEAQHIVRDAVTAAGDRLRGT